MPSWNEINLEVNNDPDPNACDKVRQKYILELESYVKRTVIAYYSGYWQKQLPTGVHPECAITDLDMNGLMAVVHNVDRSRGLDLILHTPGGGIEATRAIVEYLYSMFGKDLRVIVPHIALSAGTMIACSAKTILLGKHSSLGPTDPQIRGFAALGIIAEIDRAIVEIKAEPLKQLLWQQVFSNYPPNFILDCERSIKGSKSMVTEWLSNNMFAEFDDAAKRAAETVSKLMDYEGTSEHGHHFLAPKCREIGLKIDNLEDDQTLQELVLSVHHAFVVTLDRTNAIKIIQNAKGAAWIIGAS
jgi:hypothetical protein